MVTSRVWAAVCGTGLLAMAAIVSSNGMQSSYRPVVVYASVGNGLRVFSMNPATGTLDQHRAVVNLPGEIHYVAMHPSRRYLYVAVTERLQSDRIYAFAVDGATGWLTQIGEPFALPTALSETVHIAVDGSGKYLLIANSVTRAAVLELAMDGRLGALVTQPETPQMGRVHQVRIDSTDRWVFMPVGGYDAPGMRGGQSVDMPEQRGQLRVLDFHDGVLNQRHTIYYETGVAPRHLDFHPTGPWLYVVTEPGNLLVTYQHDAGTLTEILRSTTLRNVAFRFPLQRAGAIHVHPNGRWIYVTNRNIAPCRSPTSCPETKPFEGGENSIALFLIDANTGKPTLVENTDSEGFEPRTFTFDPTGNFLIVGNMMRVILENGDGIIDVLPNLSVFRISSDGRLALVRSYDQHGGALLWWVGAYVLPGA